MNSSVIIRLRTANKCTHDFVVAMLGANHLSTLVFLCITENWATIVEIFQNKLSSYKGNLPFIGGRLVLVNSVLTILAMYMLSFLKSLRVFYKKKDYYYSGFFAK